jgi:amino acid permease
MDLLKVDKSTVDEKGDTAAAKRNTYNLYLMNWSIAYSVICFGVFVTMLGIVYLRKITVKWKELFQEHLAFVLVLGIHIFSGLIKDPNITRSATIGFTHST